MKIAVVGLGAAGLRAAMLLEERGYTPLLFEARQRLGGRIRTASVETAKYEAGAEWLDADHQRCLSLLDQLGLETTKGDAWPRKLFFGGEEGNTASLWDDAREAEAALWKSARTIGDDLNREPWLNTHRDDLDSRTLADFIDEHASTDRARWWLHANFRSDEGDDPQNIGLLTWLCAVKPYLDRAEGDLSAYRVKDGMGAMIERMAAKLRSKPHLGAMLRRIVHDRDEVFLQFEDFEVRVDAAILTLPPPNLEQIYVEPALHGNFRCALEGVGMSRAIKIAFEFDRAWWRDEGWNGCLFSDTPLQQVWEGGLGGSPVLCAYICGDDVRRFTNRADSVRYALAELERLVPSAKGRFVRGWTHDWVSEPFSHGAFSHGPPGYALTYRRHLGKPEGRIYFAGEHTALWYGFVEGALESAERVVDEVLRA